MRLISSILLLLLGGWTALQGQSAERTVISSLGGSSNTANIYASHTLGEVQIGSSQNSNLYVGQGFESAGDHPVSLEESPYGSIELYPNPTDRAVTLEITRPGISELEVSVRDAQGRNVLQRSLRASQNQGRHSFNLADLAPGTYFFELRAEDGEQIKSLPLVVR